MRHSSAGGFALLSALLVVGCEKAAPSSTAGVAPSAASAAASASASASVAAPRASASAAASGVAAAGVAASTWKGAFTAKVAAVEPPKEAKEKTWTKDPGTASVGPGSVELAVAAGSGDVSGAISGALGDLVVRGRFDGKELRAVLAPKDASAPGAMSGVLSLALEGAHLAGTLRVSNGDARIVREAAVQLDPG